MNWKDLERLSGNWHFMATIGGHKSHGKMPKMSQHLFVSINFGILFEVEISCGEENSIPWPQGCMQNMWLRATSNPFVHQCQILVCYASYIGSSSGWHCHILAGIPHQRCCPMSNYPQTSQLSIVDNFLSLPLVGFFIICLKSVGVCQNLLQGVAVAYSYAKLPLKNVKNHWKKLKHF